MKVKLGDLIEEYSERNVDNKYKPVAVGKYGIRSRESIYTKELAKDYSKNKLIYKGTLTVGMGSNQIDIGILRDDEIYSVSPAYHTYKIKIPNYDYLDYLLAANNNRMFSIYANRGSRQGKTLDLKRWLTDELRLHDEKDQKIIVHTLNTVKQLISQKEAELVKLDELVKARFVEMFGMPGTDPFSYGIKKLGKCCELNPKKAQDKRLASNIDVSFVPMSSVSESGKIDPTDIRPYEVVKKGFTYFAEDDVLFAKITPCMENGKGAVAKGLKNGIGFGSTEFHVLRPINDTSNPYWIYTLTSFKSFRKDAEANMTGSAGQRRTPVSFLDEYEVALPPIHLQNQFATFVAYIDKSKFAVQKSLEKTQLLFDSLMQEYFG